MISAAHALTGHRLLRSVGAPGAGLVVLLACAGASAAPSARLTYVRAPGAEACVDEAGLRRAVATRLGYDPFFPWAKVTVVAHVRREARAYLAEVTLVDEAGVARGGRALRADGDDCAPLVGALAIGISLALDPLSLTRATPPPETASPPAPREPTAPHAPADVAPSPAPARETHAPAAPRRPVERWSGWIGLDADVRAGVTPGAAIGGMLHGEVARAPLAIGLALGATAPTSAPGPTGGHVKAWAAQAALLGCARLSVLEGCAVASVGPIAATGAGLEAPRSAVFVDARVGPRVGLSLPVGAALRLEGFTELDFALSRRALQVDGADAFRQPIAAGTVGLGLATKIF